MKRRLNALSGVAAFAALTVAAASAPVSEGLGVEVAVCTQMPGAREAPNTYLDEDQYDDETDTWAGGVVVLACGGIGGRVMGPGIGLAKPGGYIPRTTHGVPGKGTLFSTKLTTKKMRSFARDKNVPVPSPTAKKAGDMRAYGVYQIMGKNAQGEWVAYKYGITRVGATRPASQVKNCSNYGLANCTWAWTRTNVRGWYRARNWEAHHAARYKATHGRCPPGMMRCL